LQSSPETANKFSVALLTGGGDRPYAFGLATALMSKVASLDVIGSDELDCPELRGHPAVNFLNLRGDLRPDVGLPAKVIRVLKYYAKLICYAATARPRLFHILWNNRFETFDRTLLMLYYRLLGKKIVLTVHNVNAARRDLRDTLINRLTLRIQYHLADWIFVHTEMMKRELIEEFGVRARCVSVIPFGINNSVPNTSLAQAEARERLGIGSGQKVLLFFGNIASYKGLEYLVTAFKQVASQDAAYRLIIAGRTTDYPEYWASIRETITSEVQRRKILLKADFIPDDEVEVYFKAADVLVLPYRYIYQSGVLFLAYSFGLPVIASDVGSLREDVVEGETGFLCAPCDPSDLARAITKYFDGPLFLRLQSQREQIRQYANARHSWHVVAESSRVAYLGLLEGKDSAGAAIEPSSCV
jgi:glycosyltransferase involved in cell wall biosynthesis